MENLDLREILKDVPKGTKLYSPLFGECYLDNVNSRIELLDSKNNKVWLYYNGKYNQTYDGECMLYPSKEQRDWSKFELPCQFKNGDILVSSNGWYITIFNKKDFIPNGVNSNVLYYNCHYNIKYNELIIDINYGIGTIDEYRYATETEKNILFDRLQEKGYFWNDKTNSLEKYKFKVGDDIQDKATKQIYTIYDIEHDKYKICKNIPCYFYAEYQDNYELYQEKFDITTLKPYDKILTRGCNESTWKPQLFSYLDNDLKEHCYKFVVIGSCSIPQCIPYEGNEHLAGTTNDCDEYYKTWE